MPPQLIRQRQVFSGVPKCGEKLKLSTNCTECTVLHSKWVLGADGWDRLGWPMYPHIAHPNHQTPAWFPTIRKGTGDN